jgi:hypothetical protein
MGELVVPTICGRLSALFVLHLPSLSYHPVSFPGHDDMKTQFRACLERLASLRLHWTGARSHGAVRTSIAEPLQLASTSECYTNKRAGDQWYKC